MNNPPYDPNNPYSQQTVPGQYPTFNQQPGQPSYPQWPQQTPPPPQFNQWSQQTPPPPQFNQQPPQFQPSPGQFGSPPALLPQRPPKPPLFDFKARRAYYRQYPPSKKHQLAIGCGTLIGVLLLCGMCGAIANAGGSQQQPATTQVSSLATTETKPTPTVKPTPTPTLTPSPTPTPTPTPTQPPAPVQQPAQQQAPLQQAAPPPPATGVNGNPWGYDFNPGNLIYSPPGTFCNYFSCIANFPNGKGYVEECSDGMYSKSGGISGSCSKHGGNWRSLYSH